MPRSIFNYVWAIFIIVCVRLTSLSQNAIASGLQGSTLNTTTAIRLWLDSAFFSQGEVEIIKDITANSSGQLVVSGETYASFLSTKGAYVPQSWDLYWTVRRACHSVLGAIAPPKRVNCVPGLESVAYKQPLIRTMQEAYGEAAFSCIPRSYMLPSQYWVWRSWTRLTSSPPELPWVLKANEHRGRGVRVMRQWRAQRQALRGSGRETGPSVASATQPGFVLVQSYVRQQFLYDNRPSYLRLWVVVTSVEPVRAYLFLGGVVVFGDRVGAGSGAARKGAQDAFAGPGAKSQGGPQRSLLHMDGHEEEGVQTLHNRARSVTQHQEQKQRPQRQRYKGGGGQQQKQNQQQSYETHQVNYWTIAGEKMQPWTVGQLRRHALKMVPSDPLVWDRAWAHARTSIGMVLAGASRRMRGAARSLSALEGCGFEVLGVDFLLNATFHPTLVEVNALPSLARLRTMPGDPARDATTTTAGGGGGGDGDVNSSSNNVTSVGSAHDTATARSAEVTGTTMSAAASSLPALAPFDQEKERFLHHTLRLIGMPLGPPPVRASSHPASAVTSPSAAAASDAGARPATVGGVLRCLAALLRPPHNDTTALQAFLRTHRPADFSAAEGLVPALRPLLCPVPAAWGPAPGWPTLEEQQQEPTVKQHAAEEQEQVAAAAAASGALGLQASIAGGAVRGWRLTTAAQSDGHRRSLSTRRQISTSKSSTSTSSDGGGGGSGVVLDELQIAAVAAAVAELPPCQSRCFEWDALSAIADTQHELEQELDFDPIFPMAAARDLNVAALRMAEVVEGTGTVTAATAAGKGDGKSVGGGLMEESAEVGNGNGNAMGVLSTQQGADVSVTEGPQSRFQALTTGLGFVQESIMAVNMDLVRSMQYMTTKPYVLAKVKLPYGRLDATLTAYQAVRRRPGSCVGGGAEGKVEVAGGDVASCALSVLHQTLDGLCRKV